MLSLNVTIRTQLGKKSKRLRKEGFIPGVLYGRKVKSTPIVFGYKEFEKVYAEAGESSLISLNIENSESNEVTKENVVLIRDPIVHPLARTFVHVDFYQVPMDEEITIAIPLVFENEAPAVKNEGAVLVRNIYELEVRALPKDLPREISVDVSRLGHTNDSILVKDLAVPQGVAVEAEEDTVVAFVSAPIEEEIAEEGETAQVPPEEIKTEGEEKREAEAKEKAEETAAE